MQKLLVNAPSGVQEVVQVGPGGGYFDAARVLWDERVDGPLPAITLGGMIRVGPALEFSQVRMDETTAAGQPQPEPLIDLARRLAADTDARIAAIYNRWTRFDQEYVAREAAARAFAAAGYEGDCSVWVTSFAEPAGLPLQAAADIIISQADALRGALEQLGALRMRKYEITRALTAPAAQAAYDSIINQAAAIEAVL